MKRKLYKNILTFVATCFLGTAFAQKFDKKFTENFKTDKNVEVVIDASNTEINVSTWNKNQVQVDAFIEVEGISKKEAEKYFKNAGFEALGNKSKVQITSKGNKYSALKNDFVFFNNMDIKIPEIDMSNFETIVMPNINFDFEKVFKKLDNLDQLEKIAGKDGDYSVRYVFDNKDIKINSKKEWEAFKKTKDYKELKKKMKIGKEKMRKEFAKSKKSMKKELAKAKLELKKLDKEKIHAELEKAKAELKKLKLNFSSGANQMLIDGKKVKIKKRIEVKVPKDATFNLNTRHCKVKLPNTKASGKVSYGTFKANALNGGKLNVSFSPVTINSLNACNLFLNNVTDANLASVANTKVTSSSSNITLDNIYENVEVSNTFGDVAIKKIHPNYKTLKVLLSSSNAIIDVSSINQKMIYNIGDKSPSYINKASLKSTLNNLLKEVNGNFTIVSEDKNVQIVGKYSQLSLKK